MLLAAVSSVSSPANLCVSPCEICQLNPVLSFAHCVCPHTERPFTTRRGTSKYKPAHSFPAAAGRPYLGYRLGYTSWIKLTEGAPLAAFGHKSGLQNAQGDTVCSFVGCDALAKHGAHVEMEMQQVRTRMKLGVT